MAGDGPNGICWSSIVNRVDKWPAEPDGDGCPDELPESVKRFTGTMNGSLESNMQLTQARSEAVKACIEFNLLRAAGLKAARNKLGSPRASLPQ